MLQRLPFRTAIKGDQEADAGSREVDLNSVYKISDPRFIEQLDHLRKLKLFLFEEKINFNIEDLEEIDLGDLNRLEHSKSGRRPTGEEWRILDRKFSKLSSFLTGDLRKKIRIRELRTFFRTLPLVFLSTSVVVSLFYFMESSIIPDTALRAFLYYVIVIAWAISQGGLGACAFLVTSVVVKNVEQELTKNGAGRSFDTIDITDSNFLNARVLLGALFALMLGLPFSRYSINNLMGPIVYDYIPNVNQILFSLLPFLFGFSINLVIVILGRLLLSIETFFSGKA